MSKCENCIHYDVCTLVMAKAKHLTEQTVRKYLNEGNACTDHFKDKSLFVELPCKVGDTVYAISESRVEECRCYDISIGIENLVETEHNCDYECKGCPFNSWGQDYSGEYSCQGEYGVWLFKFEDFGKTVFLTKEDAEAKLKEMEE